MRQGKFDESAVCFDSDGESMQLNVAARMMAASARESLNVMPRRRPDRARSAGDSNRAFAYSSRTP